MSQAASTTQRDPFGCYVGARVRRGRHEYVVVDHTVQGQTLLFRLRDLHGDRDELIPLLELLELDGI